MAVGVCPKEFYSLLILWIFNNTESILSRMTVENELHVNPFQKFELNFQYMCKLSDNVTYLYYYILQQYLIFISLTFNQYLNLRNETMHKKQLSVYIFNWTSVFNTMK